MRLLTYASSRGPRAGVLDGDLVRPLREDVTVLDVVRAGLPFDLERWSGDDEPVRLDGLTLLPPLEPPTVRDFVAFEEHVEGVRRSIDGKGDVAPEWFEAPTFYFTNPYALVGSGAEVIRPHGSQALDYELEVGIVIGRSGTDIDPADALDHVFGYTILNDWSARDIQRREMKVHLGPAKGKDFATTLGPVLVTADELADRFDAEGFLALAMSVSVNDVEQGRDWLSNMGWPIADLVAYASRSTWVHPGDVLGTGTCGNGGSLAELWGMQGDAAPGPLQPGDVVTMTVAGIGTISNRVVQGPTVPTVGPARRRPRNRPADADLGLDRG